MAAAFTRADDLRDSEFLGADLRDARFVEADLTGVVMRGVQAWVVDIDAPWLAHSQSFLVNGVDVIPLVQAELNRRFPGRADRRAIDPEGLRAAWPSVEDAWTATLERVATMPPGTVETSVDGEWGSTCATPSGTWTRSRRGLRESEMATWWTIGCDANDPHRLADFWARALGHIPEPGYDFPERDRLIRVKVPELVALGATVVRESLDEGLMDGVVMHDPEGNEFCVT